MIINQIIHKTMQTYPTNLTENQWKVIENILNDTRKRKYDLYFGCSSLQKMQTQTLSITESKHICFHKPAKIQYKRNFQCNILFVKNRLQMAYVTNAFCTMEYSIAAFILSGLFGVCFSFSLISWRAGELRLPFLS